jgi:hypothetical protein
MSNPKIAHLHDSLAQIDESPDAMRRDITTKGKKDGIAGSVFNQPGEPGYKNIIIVVINRLSCGMLQFIVLVYVTKGTKLLYMEVFKKKVTIYGW